MMEDFHSPQIIHVGIPTAGDPVLEQYGDLTLLMNMLIGKDFHWQESREALLPGKVEILEGAGPFRVLNTLPLEQYLRCVVGSEMNPLAPAEFLKAHAVISRSWVMGKILKIHSHSDEGKVNTPERIINWEDTSDHIGFDVCSDDHCQRYQGVQPIPEKVAAALKATEGQLLVSAAGELIDTRFSKCCGGRTEIFSSCWQGRKEPSLESFDDPWCNPDSLPADKWQELLRGVLKDYDMSTGGGYHWQTTITPAEISRNLKLKFNRDIGDILDIEVISRGESGRATMIRLTGSAGQLEIGKELMIRRLLSDSHLYSSWIDITPVRESDNKGIRHWCLQGRGWGHGVGLCQIGAANMAMQGYDYKSILNFYYPGSSIQTSLP